MSPYNPDYQKNRRARLKQSGLCVVCGCLPSEEGMTRCSVCREKHNKTYYTNHREKQLRQGLCTHCGKYVGIGIRLCPSCLQMHRDRNLKRRLSFSKKIGDYFQNTCQICKLQSVDFEIFDTHHLNPTEKEFQVADIGHKDWDREVVPELEKCTYLCSICHRRLHAGRFDSDMESGKLKLFPGRVVVEEAA